jgi:hypothetical protein
MNSSIFKVLASKNCTLLVFAGLLLHSVQSDKLFAQKQELDSACIQRDLPDVLRKNKPIKEKPVNASSKSIIVFPIIGSNPATGFMVGLGGQMAFKVPQSKQFSMISGSLQATTKNQYLVILKNNIYTKGERLFLTGDWRFQIFSQATYGLGTNAPEGGILAWQIGLAGNPVNFDSLAQPMTYNFLRFHQIVSFKIKPQIYFGAGLKFDGYTKIVDEKLNLGPEDTLITSHYAYSKFYGFDTSRYFASSVFGSFIIDKRDNMIRPYKGYFLSVGLRSNLKLLGSQKNTSQFLLEWRSFHNVDKKRPAHLIGLWLIGEFAPDGEMPYMTLPATAYDQRSRSGRGYTQGRFRGNNYAYGEAEYRFPISKCGGIWSGVAFVNATTANNPATKHKIFESVRPGYGLGLRVLIDKQSRTNLALDWGFGQRSSGFYLAVSETF